MLRLAHRCKLDILGDVETEWLRRVPEYLENPQYFRVSLDFASELGSPDFLARVSYLFLKAMGKFSSGSLAEGTNSTQDLFSEPHIPEELMSALSMDQRLRLYRGLWSLLSLQNKLREVPKIELTGATCTERKHCGCLTLWSSFWKVNESSKTIDPGQLIDEAMRRCEGRAGYTKPRCYDCMKKELYTLKVEFKRRLPEYFRSSSNNLF